jgi:glycosyltransferase involved in cell wall biosynthesis
LDQSLLKHILNFELKGIGNPSQAYSSAKTRGLLSKQTATQNTSAETKVSQRQLVLAIVTNPARNDSRVLKQAKSLLAAGYDVVIYAASDPHLPKEETWEGIKFRRFPMLDMNVAVSASTISRALSLFGSEQALMKKKFDYVFGLKAQAEEAHLVYRKARQSQTAFRWILEALRLKASRKESAKATFAATKKIRKQAFLEFRQAYDNELVYLKHFLITLNCLSFGLKDTPNFIHSHDLYPLAVSTMFARECGAKVIYDAHELEVERMPAMTEEQKRFTASIEDHLIGQCDEMITVCDSIAGVYRERTGRTPTVIFNSPDTRVAVETTCGLRAATGLGKQVPLIAYTGGVGREGRGLHLVLQAMLLLPDFHFVILGPRHVKNDEWLLEQAKAIGVSQRVHLLPPVPADQVIHATKDADIGVCPIQDASLSYRFSMPNKLFEMVLAGLPIAVSDLPEMGRFVEKNKIGMTMDQTNPKSIADTLKAVYDNRNVLRLREPTLKKLILSYCWQAQEKKLINLYSRVTA